MALAYQYDVKFCRNLLEMTGDTIFKATNGAIYDKINKAKFKNDLLKLLCDMIWYVDFFAAVACCSSYMPYSNLFLTLCLVLLNRQDKKLSEAKLKVLIPAFLMVCNLSILSIPTPPLPTLLPLIFPITILDVG